MQAAHQQFLANTSKARSLSALVDRLGALTTSAVDLSDILRAELVLAVSALDHFIHELVRRGMLQIQQGNRPPTDAYRAFQVSIEAIGQALSSPGSDSWLDDAIRESHGWRSFQQPEKIAEAVSLVSAKKLWQEVGTQMGRPADDVRTTLKTIVDRRNKIAHEADMDPTNPGERWPISAGLVDDAVDFLEELGSAILKVI